MKVLVTGGTGFLGSHCVAALVARGHEVRLLARTPSKVAPTLAAVGSPAVEVVAGDVTRADDVRAALVGCQGVLHAANVYTLDPRRHDEMQRTNVTSTRHVLELAHAAGCDPIVHVSSVVALYPARGAIAADPPLGKAPAPGYIASKHAAEVVAREHQAAGHPVVTTYPGAIWGAHDPGAGELVHFLQGALGNQFSFRFGPHVGLPIADVEWLARAHAALFTPGAGPRRFNMTGHYVPWREIFVRLRRLTGRRLPLILPTPAPMALASGWLFTVLGRVLPWRLPFSYENVWITHRSAPTDDSLTHALVGPPPDLDDTMIAAIRWAIAAGHVPTRRGGQLALPAPA
jgi:dihydroflavonol-4-reductase